MILGKSHFEDDGTLFQPVYMYFKVLDRSSTITVSKYRRLPNEGVKSDSFLNPAIYYNDNSKIRVKFDGSCLKQDIKVTFTPKAILNFYIVYKMNIWP